MLTLELIADSRASLFTNVCDAQVIARKIGVEVVFKFNGMHVGVLPYIPIQDVIDFYNKKVEQLDYLNLLAGGTLK